VIILARGGGDATALLPFPESIVMSSSDETMTAVSRNRPRVSRR
jgi:hypothetical protein